MRSLVVAFAFAAESCLSGTASTTVEVDQGVLRVTERAGLTVCRDLPFAVPPMGDLRWRTSRPASDWHGIRTADKFAQRCVQGIANSIPTCSNEVLV